MQALRRREHVLAKPALVGKGRAFLIDPAVNATAQVLDELAEDHGIHARDDFTGVYADAGEIPGAMKHAGRGQSSEKIPPRNHDTATSACARARTYGPSGITAIRAPDGSEAVSASRASAAVEQARPQSEA